MRYCGQHRLGPDFCPAGQPRSLLKHLSCVLCPVSGRISGKIEMKRNGKKSPDHCEAIDGNE